MPYQAYNDNESTGMHHIWCSMILMLLKYLLLAFCLAVFRLILSILYYRARLHLFINKVKEENGGTLSGLSVEELVGRVSYYIHQGTHPEIVSMISLHS